MEKYIENHSKTVYSICWPETEELIRLCYTDKLEEMINNHRFPHFKSQDNIGPEFASNYLDWASLSDNNLSNLYPEFYPTGGASEPIREIINELPAKSGHLIVFDGEYEGYEAIANINETRVHKINRNNWLSECKELVKRIDRPAQFWCSQPSSIDGNNFYDIDKVIDELSKNKLIEIWLDFSYVGAIESGKHLKIENLTPDKVTGFVFSLSKPAGVYYRRIGGCFSSRVIGGLYGNRWFKNIDSIFIGNEWIQKIPRGFLADKYKSLQEKVLQKWASENNSINPINWVASDVILLAYSLNRPNHEIDDRYKRGNGYRVCLTPALSNIIFKNE